MSIAEHQLYGRYRLKMIGTVQMRKGEPMSESELKPCPFCGSTDIYETYSQEYALGTKNPEIFCNTCKVIFSIEDDSPYMNCDDDFKYRKDKTIEAWNRRERDEVN